ncbi:threonine/serine exporter family protein [Actinomycetaceae bacterium TAE3-ERU4]|nr:threonine/serine exporter family protein [Actinomycetaceae bacterium TAE3-ERU4]
MDPHQRLAQQSGVVLRFGRLLLSAGASSYRVKSSMARMARAVGIEEHRASVSFSDIATSAYANGTFRTELYENRTFGVNAARIDELKSLSHNLHREMAVEELNEELDKIEKRPPLYGPWVNALASGIACAGFCFLNKGGPWECFAVLIAATLGQALRRFVLHRKFNHFAVWLLCGILSSSIYIASIELLGITGLLQTSANQSGLVSAILFLIPGFPMVTSLLDMVRMDFPSALTRGTYVIAVMASAGVAVWAVTYTSGWNLNAVTPYYLPWIVLILLRFFCSFIAAWGFAILFNTPWKVCALSATIGAFVNTSRTIAVDAGFPWHAAVGIAAFTIGLLAAAVAAKTYYSRVSLSVPAVVIMIPGVPFYRALTAMNDGLTTAAIAQVVQVIFVITAIGFGLAIARMVTDTRWIVDTPTNQLPNLDSSSRREIR